MQGLTLSEKYYHEVVAPMLEKEFPNYIGQMAAGLVGDGSQCYGYDDQYSQDHDWGPAVCIWLPRTLYEAIGGELNAQLSLLPSTFNGYKTEHTSALGQGRTGALMLEAFYQKYLGTTDVPQTMEQWRRIPDHHLSTVTNGVVFRDDLGEFSRIRWVLQQGYPVEVKKKKLAYRCIMAAQSGQYNYPRMLQRNEPVASKLALDEYIKHIAGIVYLLNNKYTPYYKWLHRGLMELPILGKQCWEVLGEIGRASCRECVSSPV